MNNISNTLEQELNVLFSSYMDIEAAIELIALSTTDGFPVCARARDMSNYESDKIAAAASTLYSVSNAVSKQILKSEFETAFVETSRGNMAFVSLSNSKGEYVLAVSANGTINIAKLRLRIKNLAVELLNKIA